jgi:ribosomal protein S18 acetylase RimI-like enzyme
MRTAPWRLQVTENGDAVVVDTWREHLDILAVRALWAPPVRVAPLFSQLSALARSRGLERVLTPLVPESVWEPYAAAGADDVRRIVALQGFAGEVPGAALPDGVRLRPADAGDVPTLVALDNACFDEFWRYGEPEMTEALGRERVVVAEVVGAQIAGYSTSSLHGASATVGRLAVAPSARRRGIARALLADAARWASEREAFALTLCTQEENLVSRALYRERGFFELDERYLLGCTR